MINTDRPYTKSNVLRRKEDRDLDGFPSVFDSMFYSNSPRRGCTSPWRCAGATPQSDSKRPSRRERPPAPEGWPSQDPSPLPCLDTIHHHTAPPHPTPRTTIEWNDTRQDAICQTRSPTTVYSIDGNNNTLVRMVLSICTTVWYGAMLSCLKKHLTVEYCDGFGVTT